MLDFRERFERQRAAREAARTSWQRLWDRHFQSPWWAIRARWRGCCRRVAASWQCLTRGYTDLEWFDYAATNSRHTVVLLRRLLRGNLGVPGDFPCTAPAGTSRCGPPHHDSWTCPCRPFERWREAVEDMIFYHEVVGGIYEEPYVDPQTGLVDGTWTPDHLVMVQDPAAKRRARRGRYLYFRYYEALWD